MSGCTWNAFWVRLKASEVCLEGVLGPSWASLADLGEDLGSLGGPPGTFLKDFWIICCNLEQYVKIAKNIGKRRFFIDFRGDWEVPRLRKWKKQVTKC